MYCLTWDIKIGKYSLKTLKEVKITTSVLNLSDTATITLPGKYLNAWVEIEDKVQVKDRVEIKLGYDDKNETEFTGYVKRISRDNNSLVIECDDAFCLLEKTLKNAEYKSITLKDLLRKMLEQVDPALKVECDYDFTYDKMVIFHQTALDILKKVHEDTKANIWFEENTLHIHPCYQKPKGEVSIIYDTKVNVQSNELKWKKLSDKKISVEVIFVDNKGKRQSRVFGSKDGTKITKYVESSSESDLQKAAESEYGVWNYEGFEGNLTGWLIPNTKAGDSILLRDRDRKHEGIYYVTGVDIEFGQSGAKRKVSLGRKFVQKPTDN